MSSPLNDPFNQDSAHRSVNYLDGNYLDGNLLSFEDEDEDETQVEYWDDREQRGMNEEYQYEGKYEHGARWEDEEEYVNKGWGGQHTSYQQRDWEEERSDEDEAAWVDPRHLFAQPRYDRSVDSLDHSSASSSQTRYGEPRVVPYDRHPSDLQRHYAQHSSSPDYHPYSGTFCEPTSSLPVQTSDTVIEPDSPRYEEWSSPPSYKLKRKVDNRDELDGNDARMEEGDKRRRLLSPLQQPRYPAASLAPPDDELISTDQHPHRLHTAMSPCPQDFTDRCRQPEPSSPSESLSPPPLQKRKRGSPAEAREIAERTLKKPFRAPAPRSKVVLAKAPRRHSISPPPASAPITHAQHTSGAKQLLSRSAPAGRHRNTPSPNDHPLSTPSQDPQAFFDSFTSKQAPQKPSSRKAFKPPLLKTLPAGQNATPTASPPLKAESTQSILVKLEKEARTLRQAVKYHTDISEDDRLLDLIRQWRTAGRDVVEQIYDKVPRPDPTAEAQQTGHQGSGSWFFGTGGAGQYELTDEQERWLAQCPKNEDGEPVDDEGNVLLQMAGDLNKMVEEACEARPGESDEYIPTYQNGMSGTRPRVECGPKEWNMGNMMLRFSVDPALLGWDDDLEDWADVEE